MILCAGEALIDMLPRDTDAGEPAFAPYPGGSVFNTSIALARLGVPTAMFTGLSDDLFGTQLLEHLHSNGVDGRFVAMSERPTTLAFVSLIDGQAKYAFYDENTAGRMLSETDLPTDLDGVEALFFGGISLPVEPCGDTYSALCGRAAAERTVMIDPNIRTSFIGDEARYRARLDRMLAQADIVKVSDEDLHWLMGGGAVPDLARKLMAMGPKILCVTEGSRGVTGYTETAEIRVPAITAEVVDTVGAGDTFNAGFLAGLADQGLLAKAQIAHIEREALRAALALGTRAAAVTVGRAGADPPRRDEL
ncbi:MAG: carbohydrate kinase [Pseudomonadota bacterium]